MKKLLKNLVLIMMLVGMFVFTGCSKGTDKEEANETRNDFGEISAKAKGTTVNFYGWGGDEHTNKWIDTILSKYVKENYDITLKRVPMDIDQILNKMIGEKQAGNKEGSVDLVWINGENFYTAMENELLYGPITKYIPNYDKYLDGSSDEAKYDFGYEIKGYEVPYGKAQFVLINDSSVTNETPKNAEELLSFAKKYKGKVTYAAPPDFTGSAFVRNIIYEIVGYDNVKDLSADKEEVKKAIKPAMDYLNELKPYLWNEGKSYPATSSQVENMFSDGELVMTMSYNPNSVATMIESGRFKDTARSFIFDKGTIGNTHFVAIPKNASNIDGALTVINSIISPEMQSAKYDPKNWGDLPVVDFNKLNDEEKNLFESVNAGKGVLPSDELLEKRVPEISAKLVPIIEEIWQEEVAAK